MAKKAPRATRVITTSRQLGLFVGRLGRGIHEVRVPQPLPDATSPERPLKRVCFELASTEMAPAGSQARWRRVRVTVDAPTTYEHDEPGRPIVSESIRRAPRWMRRDVLDIAVDGFRVAGRRFAVETLTDALGPVPPMYFGDTDILVPVPALPRPAEWVQLFAGHGIETIWGDSLGHPVPVEAVPGDYCGHELYRWPPTNLKRADSLNFSAYRRSDDGYARVYPSSGLEDLATLAREHLLTIPGVLVRYGNVTSTAAGWIANGRPSPAPLIPQDETRATVLAFPRR